MARSEVALDRVRRAYERSHVAASLRGIAIAAAVTMAAAGLHRTSDASWLVAGVLALLLGGFAWRGGAWRRGSLAGVLAGLPPLVVPSLVVAMSSTAHCDGCASTPLWWCTLSCFVASSIVGTLVGHRATVDRAPQRFALAALPTAALTGLLGCGTIGLGGVAGVVVGLIAGAVTGWVVSGRTAHAR